MISDGIAEFTSTCEQTKKYIGWVLLAEKKRSREGESRLNIRGIRRGKQRYFVTFNYLAYVKLLLMEVCTL